MAGLDPYNPKEVPGPFRLDCMNCNHTMRVVSHTQAMCVVCPHCGSVHDLTTASVRVMLKLPKPLTGTPIPLGKRGKLRDITWEVIGIARCREDEEYFWYEYTLFNPEHGYAYLSEFNGHWNFIRPQAIRFGDPFNQRSVDWQGDHYRLFHKYNSRIVTAAGEFTFLVNLKSRIAVQEYVAPPYMLSREKSGNGIEWLKAEYTEAREIADAFGVMNIPEPPPGDIFSNQPYKSRIDSKTLARFVMLVIGIMLVFQVLKVSTANNEKVLSERYYFLDSAAQKVIVTPPFRMGGPAGAELHFKAPLENTWADAEIVLVNDITHTEYAFAIGAEYYSGYDGEAWSEGSRESSQFISSLPESQYHLEILPGREYKPPPPPDTTGLVIPSPGSGPLDMDSLVKAMTADAMRSINTTSSASPANKVEYFDIELYNDVPVWSNLFITSLALLIVPVFIWWRRRRFERNRWMNSNYSPYFSEDDEE